MILVTVFPLRDLTMSSWTFVIFYLFFCLVCTCFLLFLSRDVEAGKITMVYDAQQQMLLLVTNVVGFPLTIQRPAVNL